MLSKGRSRSLSLGGERRRRGQERKRELGEGRESWARQVHRGGDLDLHLKRRGMRGLGQK